MLLGSERKQDVCYDVVRKCPIHLKFRCPPVNDQREYFVPPDCNAMDMVLQSPASKTIPGSALSVSVLVGIIAMFL